MTSYRNGKNPVAIAAAISLVAACQLDLEGEGGVDGEDPAFAETDHEIIGGSIDPADPAVVMTQTADGQCTGTLIAPNIVLTAAHCIKVAADDQSGGRVFFGSRQGEFFETINIARLYAQRYYTSGLFDGYDIGLIRLAEDAPVDVEPLPMNARPLGEGDLGAQVRTIGFGVNDGEAQTGAGVKRHVTLTINNITNEHIVVGTATQNTCQGDSGGPTLLEGPDGVEQIISVTSFGNTGCGGDSHKTRVDRYLDLYFLRQVMAAWDGPCAQDNVCDPEQACTWPDPDCDVCGLDGICGQDCETLDLDCPIGGRLGELCTSDLGCDSRLCEPAPEDADVRFCTSECDPDVPSSCPENLGRCVDDGGGRFLCRYLGVTPTVAGAVCETGANCKSGICDPKDLLCVDRCGDDGSCPDGLSCNKVDGEKVCTLPRGGCSAAGAQKGELPLAGGGVLLLAMWLATRRRRRGVSTD